MPKLSSGEEVIVDSIVCDANHITPKRNIIGTVVDVLNNGHIVVAYLSLGFKLKEKLALKPQGHINLSSNQFLYGGFDLGFILESGLSTDYKQVVRLFEEHREPQITTPVPKKPQLKKLEELDQISEPQPEPQPVRRKTRLKNVVEVA
jgi:hypothetical protein